MTECERILMMIWTTKLVTLLYFVFVFLFLLLMLLLLWSMMFFQSIFVEIIFCVNKYWSWSHDLNDINGRLEIILSSCSELLIQNRLRYIQRLLMIAFYIKIKTVANFKKITFSPHCKNVLVTKIFESILFHKAVVYLKFNYSFRRRGKIFTLFKCKAFPFWSKLM